MKSPVEGGYYAYRVHRKEMPGLFHKGQVPRRAYRVVKVWKVHDQGVWLAVFGELFGKPPIPLDPSRLTTYFATLPLTHDGFRKLRAEHIYTGVIEPDELEGWQIAHDDPEGFGYVTVRPDQLKLDMLNKGYGFPKLKGDA